MKSVVAKLTDAEARLLNHCLCLALEYETCGSNGGGGINDKQANMGRRIVELSLKLGIETGWDANTIKSRKEIENELRKQEYLKKQQAEVTDGKDEN